MSSPAELPETSNCRIVSSLKSTLTGIDQTFESMQNNHRRERKMLNEKIQLDWEKKIKLIEFFVKKEQSRSLAQEKGQPN